MLVITNTLAASRRLLSTRVAALALVAALAVPALGDASAFAREQREPLSAIAPARSLEGNFLAGYIASLARDTAAASVFMRQALAADPTNPELMERGFVAFLASGSIDDAVRLARQMVRTDPDNGLARLAIGVDELRRGRWSQARGQLEPGGPGRAADLTATLLAAWAHAGAREDRTALGMVDRLEGEGAFDVFRLYHGGLVAAFLGQPAEAERRLASALEQQPGALSLVDAYARLVARRGRPDDAIAAYERFLEIMPRHPLALDRIERLRAGERPERPISDARAGAAEVLYALGSAGNMQGDELPAIIYLRLALHLAPDHPMALITLGDILERMDRFEEAISLYEAIDPASPLRATAALQIGLALNRLDRPEEALEHLRVLKDERPDDIEVVVAYANVLRTNERWEDAAAAYTRAIDAIEEPDASHWTLFFFRGASYERAKQWPLAEADLKVALELVPETSPIGRAQVLNYLGYSWVDMGMHIERAFEMLQEAVALSPNDGMIIDSLGWAYFRLGRYEDAVRELERAVELKPADPVINDHLGDAYWRVGRRLEARFQWQHALDSDPEPDEREKIERKLAEGLPDEPAPPSAAEATPPAPTVRDGG